MGGRGGGRGRGGGFGRGRGGFGGPSLPPGVDFKDIQASMAAPSALYPPMDIPNMTPLDTKESKAVRYQIELIERMRQSKYWIVQEETKKPNEIEHWFDRIREQEKMTSRMLKQEDFNQEFFPSSLWDGYFYPAKKLRVIEYKKKRRKKLDIDALGIDDKEGGEANEEEADEDEEEERQEDYDVEDLEGDDDYEANYFDNGEADDDDDMNDDGDRGGGDYD